MTSLGDVMPETAREEAEAKLRELALKARSRGPWTAETLDDEPTVNWTFDTEGHGPGHGPLAWCNHPEDALYIAAVSPEAVLALLDEAVSLRALLSVPETENWEYGIRYAYPGGDRWTATTRDHVESVMRWHNGLYEFARRTAPGDWERWPVPVEEDNR